MLLSFPFRNSDLNLQARIIYFYLELLSNSRCNNVQKQTWQTNPWSDSIYLHVQQTDHLKRICAFRREPYPRILETHCRLTAILTTPTRTARLTMGILPLGVVPVMVAGKKGPTKPAPYIYFNAPSDHVISGILWSLAKINRVPGDLIW